MTPTWIRIESLTTITDFPIRRPVLFFFPTKTSLYKGSVYFGYFELLGPNPTIATGGCHDGDPAYYADVFGEDFMTPDAQLAAARAGAMANVEADRKDFGRPAVVHASRDGGHSLLCTGQPRVNGEQYVALRRTAAEDPDDLVDCQICLSNLPATAASPMEPPIPRELPAEERVAAALERIAERLDLAADDVVRAIDHYRRNILGR